MISNPTDSSIGSNSQRKVLFSSRMWVMRSALVCPNQRAWSEPAALGGDADGIRAVASTQLRDGSGDAIAHRALRQVQGACDLGDGGSAGRGRQYLPLAAAERAGPEPDRRRGQPGVHHLVTGGRAADRFRQDLGRGVLRDEPGCARGHRPLQEAGTPEGGHHQGPARRQLARQVGDSTEPIPAGQLDVNQGHPRLAPAGRLEHLVAPGHLGDDLEVGLELQEPADRGPEHRLVLRDQDPDHAGAGSSATPSAGTETWTRKPPSGLAPQSTVPPSSASRSRRPARPDTGPFSTARPSSRTSTQAEPSSRPMVSQQCAAPLWRTTLVTASRTEIASAPSAPAATGLALPDTSNAIPAAARAARAPAICESSVGAR